MANIVVRGQGVRGLAMALGLLLALAVLVRWGAVILEQGVAESAGRPRTNSVRHSADILEAVKTMLLVRIYSALVSFVVAVAVMVVLGVWVARAHANAAEAVPGIRRIPLALAVVACVVPVVGVFLLPFVLHGLGRAAGIRDRIMPLLAVWWVSGVASIGLYFSVRIDGDPRRTDFLTPAVQGDMVIAGLTTVAAAALVAAVLSISSRQEQWRRGPVGPADAVTPR